MFVQNPAKLDAETKGKAISNFYTTQLGGVCAPIQNEVKQAVAAYVNKGGFAKQSQCTLDSSIADPAAYQAFESGADGSFTLDAFYSYIQPENNSLMASNMALDALDLKVASDQYYLNQQISQGNGFFPQSTCINQDEQGNCTDSEVTTPGYIISQELGDALSRGQFDQLIDSEDASAVIGSVGNQIYSQVFSSGGSLLGLSSSGGSGSFVDALANAKPTGQDGSNPVTITINGGGGNGGIIQPQGPLTKASALAAMNLALQNIAPGGVYEQNKSASLALMDQGIASVMTIETCYRGIIASTTVALSPDNLKIAEARIDYASSTIIAVQLEPVRDMIAGDLAATTTIAGDIQGLVAQMTAAKKIGVVVSIFSSFQQFLSDNSLGDLTGAPQLKAIGAAVGGLSAQVASGIAECQAFPPSGP